MTKTEVQLLSKAQAVEIKAYAVAGTIKERDPNETNSLDLTY